MGGLANGASGVGLIMTLSSIWSKLVLLTYLIFVAPVVATDDERIADCCRGFGADVIMTSESCRNGEVLVLTI